MAAWGQPGEGKGSDLFSAAGLDSLNPGVAPLASTGYELDI